MSTKRHRIGKGTRHTPGKRQWIVLAKADTEQVLEREGRIDLGERHKFKEVPVGQALTWRHPGSRESEDPADFERAEKWARENGYRVFVYPKEERDPLARARREVIA
jgi:hypothetical protein